MSHILLALETSGTRCGVALLQGDLTHATVTVDHHDGSQEHAERLLPMVTALLSQANLTCADVQAIAFGQGPGGFTGLRVACGVAQGIALALGIGVVPIGTLDAIAHDVRHRAQPVVAAVAMDARMGEAYAALFILMPEPAGSGAQDATAGSGDAAERTAPILVQGPLLLTASDLAAWLHDAKQQAAVALAGHGLVPAACAWVVAGDGWAVHAAGQRPGAPWEVDPIDRPSAHAVARLGLQALTQGRAIDAALAQPLYVRDKVAFTTLERAEGLGGNPKAAAHAATRSSS